MYVAKDIQAGEVLTVDNISVIRPGFGLAPQYYDLLLGKQSKRDLKRGTPLSWSCCCDTDGIILHLNLSTQLLIHVLGLPGGGEPLPRQYLEHRPKDYRVLKEKRRSASLFIQAIHPSFFTGRSTAYPYPSGKWR
ncbi:SAF domain-containing protein [Paenibacillus sp. sgz5001063]|uniref:SAF domain-containing protein n=1 Tax=Paenibacillus sp. sgz5001063 TaxID=3242474 RepID=UPI0036D2D98E